MTRASSMPKPTVIAVHRSSSHTFSKTAEESITIIAGLGVEGDAHCGPTVKHRSRVERDPNQPNLRQVHLVHTELFAELGAGGFTVRPGDIGENVTTRGIALLTLPAGSLLQLGADAIVEIAGLRNPCYQLDDFQKGLMAATLARDANGDLVRKAGVMAIVRRGGEVRAGDAIGLELPPEPHQPLKPV
jgi:MOSC domain-containing protein YiiM